MRIIADFTSAGHESVFEAPRSNTRSSLANDPLTSPPCTILVIDDDPGLQRLIQQALAPGATVLQELDGISEYLDTLDFEGVDAVILDYKMPRKDGLNVLKQIRKKYDKLPVLFMTGFGDLEVARKAIAAGANEYFPKPFDPSDLRDVISKWVPPFDLSVSRNGSTPSLSGDAPLTDLTEAENFLTSRDTAGNEFTTRVIRYNARSVVVEAEPDLEVTLGTALEDTHITLGHRSMEIVGASVLKITELAERKLVKIGLPGVWQIEGFKEDTQPEEISEIVRSRTRSNLPDYSRFDQGMRERKVIPETYRTTITDVENILQEFYDDLEPFEKFLFQVGGEDRPAIEEKMVEYAEGRFFPAMTEAMNSFEKAAEAAAKEGIQEEFRKFSQKRLYPVMLCSPFLSRVIAKPIGVPGDYGILGQLLGHPYEGHSLYGRMLNAWIIKANPAAAYRHRIDLLGKAIGDTVSEASHHGQRAKILSMASGVAYEVQRFVMDPVPDSNVDFELVDFSNRTLLEAKKLFSECQRISNPEGVDVILRQGSVVDLAKQTKQEIQASQKGQYDLVYCAGLFDYLSERLCSNVVSYLYDLTRKGGKVIVSNYTPQNEFRYFMSVIMDWELIHRTPDEFDTLMQRTSAKNNYRIVEDDTRTELYAIADK